MGAAAGATAALLWAAFFLLQPLAIAADLVLLPLFAGVITPIIMLILMITPYLGGRIL